MDARLPQGGTGAWGDAGAFAVECVSRSCGGDAVHDSGEVFGGFRLILGAMLGLHILPA